MAIQEVLQRVKELVTLLEEKVSEAKKKSIELSDKIKEADGRELKLNAMANHISARERLLGKLEEVTEKQAILDAEKLEFKKQVSQLEVNRASIDRRIKDLDDARKETVRAKEQYLERRNRFEVMETRMKAEEAARLKAIKELKGIL